MQMLSIYHKTSVNIPDFYLLQLLNPTDIYLVEASIYELSSFRSKLLHGDLQLWTTSEKKTQESIVNIASNWDTDIICKNV